ncbi:MAG: hypothetical protein AABX85_02750 [Nanoarchaeota archaeon]
MAEKKIEIREMRRAEVEIPMHYGHIRASIMARHMDLVSSTADDPRLSELFRTSLAYALQHPAELPKTPANCPHKAYTTSAHRLYRNEEAH